MYFEAYVSSSTKIRPQEKIDNFAFKNWDMSNGRGLKNMAYLREKFE